MEAVLRQRAVYGVISNAQGKLCPFVPHKFLHSLRRPLRFDRFSNIQTNFLSFRTHCLLHDIYPSLSTLPWLVAQCGPLGQQYRSYFQSLLVTFSTIHLFHEGQRGIDCPCYHCMDGTHPRLCYCTNNILIKKEVWSCIRLKEEILIANKNE